MKPQQIQDKIYEIRGVKVMLDFDLAELYETETRILKQAVRRNLDRFPKDFMFEISKEEWHSIRSQFVILDESGRGKHSKYLPFVFTEQGVAMLSSVLRNSKAININIQIIRAFVWTRNYALTHAELSTQLMELEKKYNKKFEDIYQALNYLIKKDKAEIIQDKRKRIGF